MLDHAFFEPLGRWNEQSLTMGGIHQQSPCPQPGFPQKQVNNEQQDSCVSFHIDCICECNASTHDGWLWCVPFLWISRYQWEFCLLWKRYRWRDTFCRHRFHLWLQMGWWNLIQHFCTNDHPCFWGRLACNLGTRILVLGMIWYSKG